MKIKSVFVFLVFLTAFLFSAQAQDSGFSDIPDQEIPASNLEHSNLLGSIQGGECEGVQFFAQPNLSSSLASAYRPKALIAKLDPSLKIEGIGIPGVNDKKDLEDIYSSLPNTEFQIKNIISENGQKKIEFGASKPTIVVIGYTTVGSRPVKYDELIHAKFKKDNHVFISGYLVHFKNFPSCEIFRKN
ncbi:hypothetical protein GLF_2502 [Gluconobacter frateurii NBRC 101659]|nr:hypothetical protein GLF_2502 [Gluconobacter frateurii NBRC 101659]